MPDERNGGNIDYVPERRTSPQQLVLPRWVVTSISSFILFIFVHFGATVWWASQITAELRAMRSYIIERTNDRYTGTEAKKDMEAIRFRFERNERWIEGLENKIEGAKRK